MIWRTGRKVGRTIYAQDGPQASDDDRLIGVMDTPELAAQACEGHNTRISGQPVTDHIQLERRSLPGRLRYLAAKLSDGQEYVSPVILALDVIADEMEALPATADATTENEGFRAYKAGLAAGRAEGAAAERNRIRQLAAEHERLFVPAGVRSFAALLTEGDTT